MSKQEFSQLLTSLLDFQASWRVEMAHGDPESQLKAEAAKEAARKRVMDAWDVMDREICKAQLGEAQSDWLLKNDRRRS